MTGWTSFSAACQHLEPSTWHLAPNAWSALGLPIKGRTLAPDTWHLPHLPPLIIKHTVASFLD